MGDAQERQLWQKLHAALCKRPRIRHALRYLSEQEEMKLADAAVKIIKQSGAFAATNEQNAGERK